MTTSSDQQQEEESTTTQRKSDFSIEHILTRAGNNKRTAEQQQQHNPAPFPWIHCTRYCPPKLSRTPKRDGIQRRQLGRHPRIPFSSHQLTVLEEKFKQAPYLSSAEVTQLSRQLQLADIRVKIWFQNRRARERRELKPETTLPEKRPQTHFIQKTENMHNFLI